MNVFLIGFMGSGKSKLGKRLSGSLNRPFIDLDREIESREGKSISELFFQHGEEYFRQVEKKVLFDQYGDKNLVVSLGGGACCNESSWKFLEENGLIIYIKESPEILLGRLKEGRSNRPLIASMNDDALKSYIQTKLIERSEFYDRAHFTYEKDKTGYSFLVNQIETYFK